MDFSGKVAVVTGGSSGIGRAIAERFSRAGAHVVITGRNSDLLKETASELESVHAVQCDVRDLDSLQNLFSEAEQTFGKIDFLIANAGVSIRGHVTEVDEKMFDEVVDTNYKGVFFTVQKSLPHLNDGAAVVLLSSIDGHLGAPSHSVYSSTKAAVSQLAKNFAADLIDRGIRVNAISPGYTDTPIFGKLGKKKGFIEEASQKIPMRRFASPDEIAQMASFLVSSESAYVTGQDMVVDGGYTAIDYAWQ